MRSFPIGEIVYKIIFLQLPEIKDPIVKGLDYDSELVGSFLSQWDSMKEAKDLLEYLNMFKNRNYEYDDYEDLIENGIYDDNGSTLFFADDSISIVSNEKETKKIAIDIFIKIVKDWETYLRIIRNHDVVFYGGSFFYDIEITNKIAID